MGTKLSIGIKVGKYEFLGDVFVFLNLHFEKFEKGIKKEIISNFFNFHYYRQTFGLMQNYHCNFQIPTTAKATLTAFPTKATALTPPPQTTVRNRLRSRKTTRQPTQRKDPMAV